MGKVLQYLNDNPQVFGGSRRPIVEFAIEDKRKLRMQEELYQKHAHKLAAKTKSPNDTEGGKGDGKGNKDGKDSAAEGNASSKKKLKSRKERKEAKRQAAAAAAAENKDPSVMSRGQRQRAKRRAQRA